jgi:hypothetical protein
MEDYWINIYIFENQTTRFATEEEALDDINRFASKVGYVHTICYVGGNDAIIRDLSSDAEEYAQAQDKEKSEQCAHLQSSINYLNSLGR